MWNWIKNRLNTARNVPEQLSKSEQEGVILAPGVRQSQKPAGMVIPLRPGSWTAGPEINAHRAIPDAVYVPLHHIGQPDPVMLYAGTSDSSPTCSSDSSSSSSESSSSCSSD